MKEEVKSAGEFVAKLLTQSTRISQDRATNFSEVLQTLICNHYVNHWFPEKPFKGSAYRCLRVNSNKKEPLIQAACRFCGFTDSEIEQSLPCELTLWIDPQEVSYRIGENGSVCVLYSENENSMDQSSDGDITDSSLGSSPSTSPSTSPSKSPVHFQSPVVNNHNARSSNSRRRRRHNNNNNFQRASPMSSDVQNGCNDPWITHDQSHIQKLSAYVYS